MGGESRRWDESWPTTQSERRWLHARWPRLPILLLAHPGQGVEHRMKELGLADVLLKPFDVPHLVQIVERLVASQNGLSPTSSAPRSDSQTA